MAALILLRREGGHFVRGRLWLLVALAPFLVFWQINAPLADFRAVQDHPSVKASFYAPLLGELRRLDVGYRRRPARIEVVPTAAHWEARWVAPDVMLARGWERQLDRERNGVFYEAGGPNATELHAWLLEQGVSLVALPAATLDYSGRTEARLLRNGPPTYLREIWRSPHWRLFAVKDPAPLLSSPGILGSVSTDGASLLLPRPGATCCALRFTPYWELSWPGAAAWNGHPAAGRGCSRASPGRFELGIGFSLGRVLDARASLHLTIY